MSHSSSPDVITRRYPVNMPDPIRTRFLLRPFMVITANVQSELGRIVYAGSDFPYPIQFHFFSKEGMDRIAQIRRHQVVTSSPVPATGHGEGCRQTVATKSRCSTATPDRCGANRQQPSTSRQRRHGSDE